MIRALAPIVFAPIGIVLLPRLLRRFLQGSLYRSDMQLNGKTAVVTGANSGIGLETAKDLYARGARVLLLCRNEAKGRAAIRKIEDEVTASAGELIFQLLDLSSMKSIRACAKAILATEKRLDFLILNAGVMMCPLSRTKDGFETQIGTNHLGHFLLTRMLMPLLKENAGEEKRVIVVSSVGHYGTLRPMRLHDINWLKESASYRPMTAYAQSKLANILFATELSRRLRGSGINVYAVHPGVVSTELERHAQNSEHLITYICAQFIYTIPRWFIKTPLYGAQTTLYCCLDPGLSNESGEYYADCAKARKSWYARRQEDARRLWDLSEQLTECQDMYM